MKAWKYKVVKQMRGMHGEWFDFPTAATFDDEADARAYAEQFAREQGAAGVRGARIAVRSRKQRLNEAGWPTHHVATYKSDDYLQIKVDGSEIEYRLELIEGKARAAYAIAESVGGICTYTASVRGVHDLAFIQVPAEQRTAVEQLMNENDCVLMYAERTR